MLREDCVEGEWGNCVDSRLCWGNCVLTADCVGLAKGGGSGEFC